MVTLTDVHERVRRDLSDLDSETWPDEQLDRHIGHALSELSLAIPQELSAEVATTAGSRDIDLSALDGLIDVEAVEFPIGRFPPSYVGLSSWGGTTSLHLETAPDGSAANVFYTAAHTLDEDGTSLPDYLVDVLVTGASAFAAQELAAGTTNVLSLQPGAAERYAAWARARKTAFGQLLHTHGRKNRLRGRRMYVPA